MILPQDQKEMFNESVKLLELLNLLIPRLGENKISINKDLAKEIADLCFSLGGNLYVNSDDLEIK